MGLGHVRCPEGTDANAVRNYMGNLEIQTGHGGTECELHTEESVSEIWSLRGGSFRCETEGELSDPRHRHTAATHVAAPQPEA